MTLVRLTDPRLVAPGGRIYGLDARARLAACLDHVAADVIVHEVEVPTRGPVLHVADQPVRP